MAAHGVEDAARRELAAAGAAGGPHGLVALELAAKIDAEWWRCPAAHLAAASAAFFAAQDRALAAARVKAGATNVVPIRRGAGHGDW